MFSVELHNIESYKYLNLDALAKFVLERKFTYNSNNLFIDSKQAIEVNIIFTDIKTIHRLNFEYRKIDRPTDVLSFSYNDSKSVYDIIFNSKFKSKDKICIGEIYICPDIAKKNANDLNTSIDSELKLLVVHGCLHLCGYDHKQDIQAKAMEDLEDNLLNEWANIQ